MAIFTRPDGEIFAENAKQGEVVTFPDLKRGWGVTLDTTNGIPPMEFFNFTGNRADRAINYLLQNGIAPYSDDTEYPKDAVVRSGGILYIARKQTKGVAPGGESETWNYLIPPASLSRAGIAQLSSSTTSTSETMAATPKAVKVAVDLANKASVQAGKAEARANSSVKIDGSTPMTGDLTIEGGSLKRPLVIFKPEPSDPTTKVFVGGNDAGSFIVSDSSFGINPYRFEVGQKEVFAFGKKVLTATDEKKFVKVDGSTPMTNDLIIGGTRRPLVSFRSTFGGDVKVGAENDEFIVSLEGFINSLRLNKGGLFLENSKVLTEANFAGSLSSNGWCRLPNGLLLQWLSWKAPDQNSSVKRAWPIAFKEVFSVAVSNTSQNSNNYATDIFYSTTQVWGRYQLECRVFAVGL